MKKALKVLIAFPVIAIAIFISTAMTTPCQFYSVKSYLLSTEGINREKVLHQASYCGCDHVVQRLINKGADVNALDAFGTISLQEAVHRNEINIMNVLLEAGADPRTPDRWGRTAIDVAKIEGRESIVAILEEVVARLEKEEAGE